MSVQQLDLRDDEQAGYGDAKSVMQGERSGCVDTLLQEPDVEMMNVSLMCQVFLKQEKLIDSV